ncbi:hypothetical protein [Mycolicibacterium houstonense]|uniref:hypothetical protein n=1 Tax=Mycolicibacterium houstonense TaxID=146021 RepID=UPI00093E83F5|nr:hypothetical protein [Mycolicibacterium houstonense]
MADDVWVDKHQRQWFGYWQRRLDGTWGYRMHFSGWEFDGGDIEFPDFEKCFGPVEPAERVS